MPKISIHDLPELPQRILSRYLSEVDSRLPGFLKGFYIYGSLALDDFHPRRSDIDFVAVTGEKPTARQLHILDAVHRSIQRTRRKPNMNGIYLPPAEMNLPLDAIPPFPYFFEGRMHASGLMELNEVLRYQLKHHALVLRDAGPEALSFPTAPDALRDEMRENSRTYWRTWLRDHTGEHVGRSMLMLFARKIEWGVLGVSRQYYTVRTGKIVSKREAGIYCMKELPATFRPILAEAVRIRTGRGQRLYWSPFQRKKEAAACMEYLLAQLAED